MKPGIHKAFLKEGTVEREFGERRISERRNLCSVIPLVLYLI